MISAFLCSSLAVVLAWILASSGSSSSAQAGTPGQWKPATATFYHSYPACCKDSPNYDPAADRSECSDFSGCKYMGMFAAFADRKSLDWVKTNNIVAFFEAGQTDKSWASKWKNRRLRIRNPKTGKTMEVTVIDQCADSDCGGCCTRNANKHGGTLLDLEWHTAQRFWSPGEVDGMGAIEFQTVE